MTDPMRQMAQPILPNVPNRSFKKYEPNTDLRDGWNKQAAAMRLARCAHPISTLSAPRGVTNMAGANA